MSEYDDLLIEAYRGEVLGAALFGAMADTEADDGRRQQLAAGAREQPWHDFLRSLRSALPSYLENFERLQTIGAPGDPILAELVAHERAIDRFAELEVEGRSVEALAVLRGHLDASRTAVPRA